MELIGTAPTVSRLYGTSSKKFQGLCYIMNIFQTKMLASLLFFKTKTEIPFIPPSKTYSVHLRELIPCKDSIKIMLCEEGTVSSLRDFIQLHIMYLLTDLSHYVFKTIRRAVYKHQVGSL